MEDTISLFTQIELQDLIYHQHFLTANNWGLQPTIYSILKPLTLPTSLVADKAIPYVSSEYSLPNKATSKFPHNEYLGAFCPSPIINFTLEATAFIMHTLVCRHIPLPPPSAQLHQYRHCIISVGTPQPCTAVLDFTLNYSC